MKAMLVIEYENEMKELVRILAENGYEVKVKKTGGYCWWEHKYQVEISKDESNHNT